jgi:hypothetical protein
LLYKDFTDGFLVADTVVYLSAIGGNPLTEFDAAEDFPIFTQETYAIAADSAELGIIENNRPLWRIKTGYQNRASVDNSCFIAQSESDDAELFYKGQKRDSKYSAERRSLKLKGGSWNVTLGNYTADIGAGIGIGRYDYRPLSNPDDESDIIYPDNSYYNGLKVEYLNKASILYSAKKYSNLYKAFYGAAVSTDIRECNIGISAAATCFSAGNRDLNLGSGSIYIVDNRRRLKMEAAYAESGIGFFAESILHSFKLKGWYYSDSYLSPQSSGYAYPDYKSFKLFDDYSFRQTQAGESGFYIGRLTQVKKIIFRSAVESWIVSKPSVDISCAARYPLSDNFYLSARISGRGGAIKDRYQYEMELACRRIVELKGLSTVRISSGQVDHHNSFSQIYIMFPAGVTTFVGGRLRFRYDSNFEFFFEEKTVIGDSINLKATYRWRETDGQRLGPFYLVAECVI